MNTLPEDGIKSQIMHILFTPVGQRLRKPTFGSHLIQFLFEPNDSQSWGDIVSEIKEMISSNVKGCTVNNVEVYDVNEGLKLVVKIQYTVSVNGRTYNDEIISEI